MGRAELLRYWIEDRTCVVCPWHEDCLEAVCMFQPLILWELSYYLLYDDSLRLRAGCARTFTYEICHARYDSALTYGCGGLGKQ